MTRRRLRDVRVTERQVLALLRLALGAAAFGLAFTHTLDWLGTHGIEGAAGAITACCVDVLAAICLRLLLGPAASWAVRLLALAGLGGAVAISAAAQVHSVSDDRVGERLALVPLGAFVLLQVIHEVEQRGRRRPAQVDTRLDTEVDTTGGQVDTPEVDTTPSLSTSAGGVVSTSLSTSGVHLAPPPVSTWDEVATRLGGAAALPIVARPAPVKEPEQRRPRPRKAKAPELHLASSNGLPADVLAALTHPDPDRRMTHEAAAAKLGVSTRTISRRLGRAQAADPRQRRSGT